MAEKLKDIQSADTVSDESGRQYHIGVAPGELAEYIIVVGDPDRPAKAKRFFDEIQGEWHNREFNTITGKVNDFEISIMSTGIGTDNVEICMIEIMQITKNPTIIRAGSCGGLQEFINVGDLVISTGAVRVENTSDFFVPPGYPSIANSEVVMALVEAAEFIGVKYHIGLTATASGFYGAQGRKIPGITMRYPTLPDDLAKINVYNFEMESSALFNLGQVMKIRTGTICAVYANRPKGEFIPVEMKKKVEEQNLKAAFEAFKVLRQMDQKKKEKDKKHWFPSLGL
ncbi:MAG: nucleoside phosphorylase [Candidatus Hodarchaeota archaeon]